MDATNNQTKEMSALSKVIGIFTEPKATLESIDRKPSWIVPFIILSVVIIATQLVTMDIRIADQIAALELRDLPPESMEAAQAQANSPFKYVGLVISPVAVLAMMAIIAGVLLLAGNLMIGGETNFKKIFAIVMWSSLIGIINIALVTFIGSSRGTFNGVAMDLATLLPTPDIGEEKTILYRLLSRFDIFTFWEMALWTLGLSVTFKSTIQKAVTPVVVIWVIWVVVAVSLGGLFGAMFGM